MHQDGVNTISFKKKTYYWKKINRLNIKSLIVDNFHITPSPTYIGHLDKNKQRNIRIK